LPGMCDELTDWWWTDWWWTDWWWTDWWWTDHGHYDNFELYL